MGGGGFRREFRALCWKWSKVTVRWQVCTLEGHSSVVWTISFSVDGKRVVSGSFDKSVKIWDAATGVLVSSFAGVLWGMVMGMFFGFLWVL